MAARVALDWGSSSLRAFRFTADGQIESVRENQCGIKFVDAGTGTDQRHDAFAAVLQEVIGDWVQAGDSILLGGMITSRNGWHETPYLRCPLDLTQLGDQVSRISHRDLQLAFLPGVCANDTHCDVMRGEEIQLLGAAASASESHDTGSSRTFVLPGTHSKWVSMRGSRLEDFRTWMTGELYQLLLEHSLLGQSGPTPPNAAEPLDAEVPGAFHDGVATGFYETGIIGMLFQARARVLLQRLAAEQMSTWLSGLLIGAEIREATQLLQTGDQQHPLTLVGNSQLCQRYQRACTQLGFATLIADDAVTAMGYQQLARQLAL